MTRRMAIWWLALGTLTSTVSASESGARWGQWRGPNMDGVSPSGKPPLTWSETSHVRLKIPLVGRGLGSPVVWDDTVFLLAAVPTAPAPTAAPPAADGRMPKVAPSPQRYEVSAYSLQDGSLRWRQVAAEKTPHEGHHGDGSFASASAVTDGRRVLAHFGSAGTYAYDLQGKLLWSIDLGDMATRNSFGEGASPALEGDVAVITWDHEQGSFLVALNAATGAELWRVDRPGEPTSWSTPVIAKVGGQTQVIVPGSGKSRGYDLKTGKELWSLPGMTLNVIPTPIVAADRVVLMSGFRGNMLQVVDLTQAKGDLQTSEAVLYRYERDTPYVPSPLLYQDQLYFLKHNGNVLTALDFKTGKPVFTEQRLDGIQGVYASPVAADGRVYVVGREGKTVVLKHGPTLEVLAVNTLDDQFDASPAIVGPDLLLRGHRSLYVLRQP